MSSDGIRARVGAARAWLVQRRKAASRTISAIAGRVASAAPLIAFGIAALTGWAALTVGVRVLLPPSVTHAVWPLSTGVLLLSACGWGMIGRLSYRGLYTVWRQSQKAAQARS